MMKPALLLTHLCTFPLVFHIDQALASDNIREFSRSSYELVDDQSGRTFRIQKNGNFMECSKGCFLQNDDDECDRCTVYDNYHVYCRKGQVSQTCRQLCCDKVTGGGQPITSGVNHDDDDDGGDGNGGGGFVQDVYQSDYEYVNHDYSTTFMIEKNGNTMECDKICFLQNENDGDDCERCEVYKNWFVKCRNGKISANCRQLCCDKNTGGGPPILNEVEDDEYELVQDLNLSDDDDILTIMPYYDGITSDCRKTCIGGKSEGKCRSCYVDRYNDVLCSEGRVHLSCRRACCDDSNFDPIPDGGDDDDDDDDDGGFSDYIKIPDYTPSDITTLTTYHDGEYYSCDCHCVAHNGKCTSTCMVDDLHNVMCLDGYVHQGCRRKCCEVLVWS